MINHGAIGLDSGTDMTIELKGSAPKPGAPDKRYFMIRLQIDGRRLVLSAGVRDRRLALTKQQLAYDMLRADPNISREAVIEAIRGRSHSSRTGVSKRIPMVSAPASMTLKQACDEALRDPLPWGRSKKGWRNSRGALTYAGQLADIQRILGADLPVTRINQDSVGKILDALQSARAGRGRPRNSGATINRKMFALFSVLRRLHERGLPAPPIPKYRNLDESGNARQFVFSAAQEQELFDQLQLLDMRQHTREGGHPVKRDGHAYRDLFVFLADVGCRLSAGLSVKWTDIFEDTDAMYVRFFRKEHLKGGKPRTTPLTSRAAEVIRRRYALGGTGPFTDLNKRRAQQQWALAKASTSLAREKEAVIHSLRHTCATRMLHATGDIKLVQEWLGHSALQTTADIYAKVLVKHKVGALGAFEARWNTQ